MAKRITISVRSVGQAFGCCAVIRSVRGRRKLAETRVFPHGFTANALLAARAIVAARGWVEHDPDQNNADEEV